MSAEMHPVTFYERSQVHMPGVTDFRPRSVASSADGPQRDAEDEQAATDSPEFENSEESAPTPAAPEDREPQPGDAKAARPSKA